MGIEGYYEDYFDDRQDEKLTNFQKIKNMTLDEMAEFLINYELYQIFTKKPLKYRKIKQWLQEESESERE